MATTWNPADKDSTVTLSNGNLTAKSSSSSAGGVRATVSKSSGKWYYEVSADFTKVVAPGIATSATGLTDPSGGSSVIIEYVNGLGWGLIVNNNFINTDPSPVASTDVIGVCIDLTNDKVYFTRNGSNLFGGDPGAGTGGISTDAGAYFPIVYVSNQATAGATANFGATSFAHTPPTGYSGFDTAAASGASGSLAATDAKDTASVSGTVEVSGTITATESKDTASLSGKVKVSGSLAATESVDTAALSGSIASVITGTLVATDTADSAALTGAVAVSGSLASTDSTDTAAFSGAIAISGSLDASETTDSAVFSGGIAVSGSLDATEGQDTASVDGEVAVTGTLDATEPQDTALINGGSSILGTLASAESPDIAAIAGTVAVVAPVQTSVGGGGAPGRRRHRAPRGPAGFWRPQIRKALEQVDESLREAEEVKNPAVEVAVDASRAAIRQLEHSEIARNEAGIYLREMRAIAQALNEAARSAAALEAAHHAAQAVMHARALAAQIEAAEAQDEEEAILLLVA